MRRGCGRRQVALGAAGVSVPGVAVPGVLRALLSWAVEGGAHPVARQRVRRHEVRLRLAFGPQNGAVPSWGARLALRGRLDVSSSGHALPCPGGSPRTPGLKTRPAGECPGAPRPLRGASWTWAGVKRIRPLSLVTVMPERVNPRA